MNKEKRTLWALLIRCPFFSGPMNDCHLERYRCQMNLEEKFLFVENLSSADVNELLAKHILCQQSRQADYQARITQYSREVQCS